MRIDAAPQPREHARAARASARGVAVDDAERPRAVVARVGAERRLAHAVLRQRLQIDVDDDVRAAEREALGLADQLAALGDQAVPVPGEVGGRLAEAGGAVDLHGEVARRRAAHQLLAVLPLARP